MVSTAKGRGGENFAARPRVEEGIAPSADTSGVQRHPHAGYSAGSMNTCTVRGGCGLAPCGTSLLSAGPFAAGKRKCCLK